MSQALPAALDAASPVLKGAISNLTLSPASAGAQARQTHLATELLSLPVNYGQVGNNMTNNFCGALQIFFNSKEHIMNRGTKTISLNEFLPDFPLFSKASDEDSLDHPVFLRDGEAVTSTLILAKGTENEHASVIKLVRSYLDDLTEFGMVGFEIAPNRHTGRGGSDTEIAILNEPQSTFLVTLMRNTDVVVRFKKALVKAFYEIRSACESAKARRVAAFPARAHALLLKLPDRLERERHPLKRDLLKAQIAQVCQTLGITPPDLDRIGRAAPLQESPPELEAFWDGVDVIGQETLNHASSPQILAFNLAEVHQAARAIGLALSPLAHLRHVLPLSFSPRFVEANRVVHSARLKRAVRCWVFESVP
jgi:phage regulator Rha-like protein